jgi:hypothetical protein
MRVGSLSELFALHKDDPLRVDVNCLNIPLRDGFGYSPELVK